MCNNVCIKFATMYYTILSSLYESASFPWERVRVYINQFFENGFCPTEEANRIVNDLKSENIKVLWRSSFSFS